MYLTAQHVVSPKAGKSGINVFLYTHEGQVVPGMNWDSPVLERVADEHVGTRGAELTEVVPGGNRVASYLDIVAADSTGVPDIEAALVQFRAVFSPEELPVTRRMGKVAIRFGAQFGLYERAREEFDELSSRALKLARNPSMPRWRSLEPLEALVEQDEDGATYTLKPESIERLRAVHDPTWAAPRVSIKHDTAADFSGLHGDLLRHLAPLLTEMDDETVAAQGGIRFYDGGGQILAEWPKR